MTNWEKFRALNALADELLAAATPDHLAEALRIATLDLACSHASAVNSDQASITESLRAGKVDEETAVLLANGMESLVGILGTVMGLDEPGKLN